jgi:hypothetical protein
MNISINPIIFKGSKTIVGTDEEGKEKITNETTSEAEDIEALTKLSTQLENTPKEVLFVANVDPELEIQAVKSDFGWVFRLNEWSAKIRNFETVDGKMQASVIQIKLKDIKASEKMKEAFVQFIKELKSLPEMSGKLADKTNIINHVDEYV